jgi:hypothetical protein
VAWDDAGVPRFRFSFRDELICSFNFSPAFFYLSLTSQLTSFLPSLYRRLYSLLRTARRLLDTPQQGIDRCVCRYSIPSFPFTESLSYPHPVFKMRLSTFIPLALAIAPSLVSAVGELGFALGNKNPDGTCKSTKDYAADFSTLKDLTRLVRIYAASDCNTAANILPAAKAAGFKVVLGIW